MTIWQILNRLAAFLIVTAVHGGALAALVRALGDRTPAYNDRLTLNPFAHVSVIAALTAALFRLGWIRPMPLDRTRLRFGRGGLVICVLGSLAVTLALVPFITPLRSWVAANMALTTGQTVLVLLDTTQDLAMWFVAFNILPLPPLTGFLFVEAAAPALAARLNSKPRVWEFVMVAAVVIGLAPRVVAPLNQILRNALAY